MQAVEIEREARVRLPDLLASLLGRPRAEVEQTDDGHHISMKVGARRWLAEVTPSSSPGTIAALADRLQPAEGAAGAIRLLVVPYMTPAGQRAAAERDLSWVDLSGNACIRDGELYVRVEGRPNAYRQRGRPATPFAPKSARVARVMLLDPARWWRQKDLAAETGLDDGHLSRIVRRLDDDGLLEQGAVGFRPRQPDLLLDAWADAYRFDRHDVLAAHVTGSGTDLAAELRRRLVAAGIRHAFTGLPAAWELGHHAQYRLASVYVKGDPRAALDAAGLRRGDRGANVQLIGPDDDGVFAGWRKIGALPCVSPPQIYLDLLHLPERAREAADQLRSDRLLWPDNAS